MIKQELLKKLATSNDNKFLKKYIYNGNIQEREIIATNINLNKENFILLSLDKDFWIRLKLIGNKHIPSSILAKIHTKFTIK